MRVPSDAEVAQAKHILTLASSAERTKDSARAVLKLAGVDEPKVDPDGYWNYVPMADVFAPLGPFPWLFKGRLRMAKGRPTLLGGYADSGKTILAQLIALSVMTGDPVLGDRPVTTGKVLHMNGEMNLYNASKRYQRLARGLGYADFEPLLKENRLKFANYPDISLSDRDVESRLCKAWEGHDLVVLDSLRAFSGALDENKPETGKALLMLGRVSQKTGAVPLLILHTTKSGKATDKPKNLAEKLSGSGSIFGGCDSAFLLDQGESSMELHHLRTPEGEKEHTPVPVAFKDVPRDGDRFWGLRMVEAVQEPEDESAAASRRNVGVLEKALTDANNQAERLVTLLRKEPFAGGRNLMLALVGGNAKRFNAALDAAIGAGVVVKEGTYKQPIWRLREGV